MAFVRVLGVRFSKLMSEFEGIELAASLLHKFIVYEHSLDIVGLFTVFISFFFMEDLD